MPTKKRILTLAIVLVVVAAGGLTAYLVHRSDVRKKEAAKQATLSTALKDITTGGATPTKQYTDTVSSFAQKTTDVKKKAKSYDTLGYAYQAQAKYTEALAAFKQEKSLADAAGLTKVQKDTIDQQIALLTNLVAQRAIPYTADPNGYQEPN